MRTGENAMQVIERVKEKVAQIAPSLPKGVTIVPFYDRSSLIEQTIETLRHALLEEIVLVTLAHIIFLWHFRSILIVTLPLPISILISFILMQAFGITSNIMSLSGIAIAIGVLVDAGIVMTENVIRHCEEVEKTAGGRRWSRLEVIRRAAHQVGRGVSARPSFPACHSAKSLRCVVQAGQARSRARMDCFASLCKATSMGGIWGVS
jgi:copper/silver efflux system protein